MFVIAGATIKKSPITAQTRSSPATPSVSFSSFGASRNVGRAQSYFVECHCFVPPVGGWFLPGQAPICPSSSPPQFTGTAAHSSSSYCERYSSLRNHRAAPYPGHYPHRSSGTSKTALVFLSLSRERASINGFDSQTTTWRTPREVCPLTTAGLRFRSPTPQAWALCPTPPTPHPTPGESLNKQFDNFPVFEQFSVFIYFIN